MGKKEEHRKKEWQKPKVKSLGFSLTYGSGPVFENEGDYTSS